MDKLIMQSSNRAKLKRGLFLSLETAALFVNVVPAANGFWCTGYFCNTTIIHQPRWNISLELLFCVLGINKPIFHNNVSP